MSKGKEKANGAEQKGTAVTDRTSRGSDGRKQILTFRSPHVPAGWPGRAALIARRLADELDQVFAGFGIGSELLPISEWNDQWRMRAWAPPAEVLRRGDRLVIRVELPGLRKEDLHVEVTNDAISIQGERQQEHEESHDDDYRSERRYGSFFRKIALPESVEADEADARFRDGVLEITIPAPRHEESRGRRLEVKD